MRWVVEERLRLSLLLGVCSRSQAGSGVSYYWGRRVSKRAGLPMARAGGVGLQASPST